MRFLRAWTGLLLKGDSHFGRVVRGVTFAVTLGAPLFLTDPMRAMIELPWGAVLAGTFPFGYGLSSAVALLYGFTTAGAAWVLSRGPVLIMGEMQPDQANRQFRLRVRNRADNEVEVSGWVDRVIDERGRDIDTERGLPSRLPYEVHWSHRDDKSKPKLSKAHPNGENLGVCASHALEGVPTLFITTQVGFQEVRHPYEAGREVWFLVRVTADGVSREKWFGFEADELNELNFRVSSRKPPRAIGAGKTPVQPAKFIKPAEPKDAPG